MVRCDQDRAADETRNVVLVSTEALAPSVARLRATWDGVRARRAATAPDLGAAIADRLPRPVPTDDVPYLTDGYAPTDALLVG